MAAVAVVQLALLVLFPSEGRYPFSPLSLAAALTVSGLGAALAWRAERGRLIAPFFVLWAVVCLGAFLVPSPFGDNLTRLRAVVFPLVLLAAVLARFRPRWLAVGALAFAFVYNLGPDVSALPKRADDTATASEAYWQPALDYLATQDTADHRVEVVPTFGHWEAWWVPREGYALARGWFRQIDLAENPELYDDPLDADAYRRWLDRLAVRWVLLPDARLGPMGAEPRGRAAPLRTHGPAGGAPLGPLDGLRGARRDPDPRRRRVDAVRPRGDRRDRRPGPAPAPRALEPLLARRVRRRLPRARAGRADDARGRTGGPLFPRDRARRGALRQGRLSRRRSGRVARMRLRLAFLLVLGLLLAVAAGCGGGEEVTPTPDNDVPAATGGTDTGTDTGGETETSGGTTDTGGGETTGGGGEPATRRRARRSSPPPAAARATRSRTRARPARSARTSTRRSPTPSS